MKNKNVNLSQRIKNIYNSLEYDIKPYENLLAQINHIKLDSLTIPELKHKSMELKTKAQRGEALDSLLVEAFALVKEAASRVIGQCPFDVQIIAAIALHQGKVIEMQTGEGKTLTAVMPGYLNALAGKGVHVLTFNDYLAGRDAAWMGPIYEFLGLNVGFVKEGMNMQQRKMAYEADVTYVTAKEAGFDYLRDFLCTDKNELVHKNLNYAIIDEADSILIDEARIPLVIAGNIEEHEEVYVCLGDLVRNMNEEADYSLDPYVGNVYLTDQGLYKAEKALKCGNLFDDGNLQLLTMLNCALHAEKLLKRDKDYIVRNGKIEIVDEFTGRIADKRHWPDNLHEAVEVKEGVLPSSKGTIMGSIALQHFISLYSRICGMTGTARIAAKELEEYYNLEVAAIPTNKPCIRKDHEDYIFFNKEAKHRAILSEVARAHGTGQPVLVGTGCIEESELLVGLLEAGGISCRVLNAKNDEKEAEIIAKAGELGAVTVSTNMAGRGVDIKLGGINESERKITAALGGLYVIGTNRHESRRIDGQLRGRAGRQGDPGESRFFVSLEDEWIKKYNILKALPADFSTISKEELQNSTTVKRIIEGGQRIVEGYNSDMRVQLWKYSFILEQQRRIIHKWRQDILTDALIPELLFHKCYEGYGDLELRYGKELLQKVEKQLTLYYINKHWADYLDYISYVKESIHLMVIGKQNPLHEFNKQAVQAFEELFANLENDIVKAFNSASITKDGIDLESEGVKTPRATWTYLINENPNQFSNLPFLMKAMSNAVMGPLFTISSLHQSIKNKIKSLR